MTRRVFCGTLDFPRTPPGRFRQRVPPPEPATWLLLGLAALSELPKVLLHDPYFVRRLFGLSTSKHTLPRRSIKNVFTHNEIPFCLPHASISRSSSLAYL